METKWIRGLLALGVGTLVVASATARGPRGGTFFPPPPPEFQQSQF